MEERLKNIGDLADAITTLSLAVTALSKRMKEAEDFQIHVLEKRVEQLEVQVKGGTKAMYKIEAQGFEVEDTLVKRIAELEEKVKRLELHLSVTEVNQRQLIGIVEQVERAVKHSSGQKGGVETSTEDA